jgi:hypothetical protein
MDIMGGRRVLLAWAILSGCGGASVSGSSDVTAFQQDVASATQALDGYQAATRTMSTAADCSAAVNGYGTPMQGDLDHMMSVSSSMDDQMRSMGQPSRADVGCGVQGMDDELRRHLQVACHEADMEHNLEEAARHIAAMGNGLQHMQMRAVEMSARGMGPGMMDGGWRMWDGGMMDPDDHPMGCPGGKMMDGGMMPGGGPGPMMDGGVGPMMDGGVGPMMDGGVGPMMDGGIGHMP